MALISSCVIVSAMSPLSIILFPTLAPREAERKRKRGREGVSALRVGALAPTPAVSTPLGEWAGRGRLAPATPGATICLP